MRPLGNRSILVLLLIAVAFVPCNSSQTRSRPAPSQTSAGPFSIIVSAAPVYDPLAAIQRGAERFPQGVRLLLLRDNKAESLLPGFFASADASVSFDAKTVIFAGKKTANDPWQIWELSLTGHSQRKVISGSTNLIRPLYLPDNRLVYARQTPGGFQMEAASLDGSQQLPLSHIRTSAIPVDVLQDGRILFESMFPLGEDGRPELYLVYSDGSGVESYRCDHGPGRWGGHQLTSGPQTGDVVFTHGRTLARFTSPLAAESPIAAPAREYAGPIAETSTGKWIVSVRTNNESRFSLALKKAGAAALQPLFSDTRNNLVEPVLLTPRPVPKRHPTALHEWTTANLLALDVRQSRDGSLGGMPVSVRIDAQGQAGIAVAMGIAPIESDGSFFVKTPADRPIRFTLLDRNGSVLRAERGWFWIRSGEQRICVGCHTGPERAPENRVPQVLLRSTTPVDLSGAAPAAAAGGR